MSLETVYYIGQNIAVLTIIATLVAILYQSYQANKIATWETHRSAVIANSAFYNELMSNDGVAHIFRTGLLDMEALDETQRVRFNAILINLLLNFKDTLDAYDKGLFDKPTYEAWEGHICSMLNMPGGAAWWAECKHGFIERVRDVIDQARPEVIRQDAMQAKIWMSEITPEEPRASSRESHRSSAYSPPTRS